MRGKMRGKIREHIRERKNRKKTITKLVVFLCMVQLAWACPAGAAVKKPAKPSAPSVQVDDEGRVYVEMKGSEVSKTDGYAVYLASSPDGTYENVDQWSAGYDDMFPETCVCELWSFPKVPGKYYVKVKTFNRTKKWKYKYSDASDVVSFEWAWKAKAEPAGVQMVKLHADSAKAPMDSAAAGKDPQEYEICRSISENDGFSVISNISGEQVTYSGISYEDTDAAMGTEYYYKVRALFYDEEAYERYLYPEEDDWTPLEETGGYADPSSSALSEPGRGTTPAAPEESMSGTDSVRTEQMISDTASRQAEKPQPLYVMETEVTKGHPGPLSTSSLQSKAGKNNRLKLSWKAVKGVDGYYLYQLTGSAAKKTKIAKVSGGKSTYTWKKREHAKRYQVVIVPYMTVNGKEVTGADSAAFTAVMNYYTSPYDNKIERFFGKNASKKFDKYEQSRHEGTEYYSSESAARKQIQTIWIRVWDFQKGKSGKKVTKRVSLTVHKKVAPSLKKAFDEIYNGKEKFPIHSIGGFSYRWGQHGVGLAVDINPNENAQFKDGKAVCGSYYRPGKDPYSIPEDGEVARILWKYGFTQLVGDYMHFSYFGT